MLQTYHLPRLGHASSHKRMDSMVNGDVPNNSFSPRLGDEAFLALNHHVRQHPDTTSYKRPSFATYQALSPKLRLRAIT